jgi:hypothetical protein
LLLHNHSFLLATVTDWLVAGAIAAAGFFGDVVLIKMLTLRREKSRNGWTDLSRMEATVVIGLVARYAAGLPDFSWYNFQTKNPYLGNFWTALETTTLVYFVVIWNILQPGTQCCQIFLGSIYPNREKYTKSPQNIPDGHEMYQMAIK